MGYFVLYFFVFALLLLAFLFVWRFPWLLLLLIPFVALFIWLLHEEIRKNHTSDADEIQAEEHMGNTINTKLVGVTHENHAGENIQDILPLLHKGNALAFVREYDNSYDENAISVYCGSNHIGYLDRKTAEHIAKYMDMGVYVTGKVTEVTGGGNVSFGCRIELLIHE